MFVVVLLGPALSSPYIVFLCCDGFERERLSNGCLCMFHFAALRFPSSCTSLVNSGPSFLQVFGAFFVVACSCSSLRTVGVVCFCSFCAFPLFNPCIRCALFFSNLAPTTIMGAWIQYHQTHGTRNESQKAKKLERYYGQQRHT